MNNDAAYVASLAYFRALRREWVLRSQEPVDKCPVPNWEDIRPMDQQSFLRCMTTALNAAKPENVARVMERMNNPS